MKTAQILKDISALESRFQHTSQILENDEEEIVLSMLDIQERAQDLQPIAYTDIEYVRARPKWVEFYDRVEKLVRDYGIKRQLP